MVENVAATEPEPRRPLWVEGFGPGERARNGGNRRLIRMPRANFVPVVCVATIRR